MPAGHPPKSIRKQHAMKLFRFLLGHARNLMIFIGLAALFSGACNAGLIALVNAALIRSETATAIMVWGFSGLGLGKLATNFISQVLLARFSQSAITNLRRDLIQKRLKLSGAWWKETNAQALITLRTARANQCWETYWTQN